MKKLLILVILCGNTAIALSQYGPQWINASGDYFRTGTMLAVDSNDEVVVTGYRPSFSGNGHIFTRKIDASGNLLWEQTDSTGIAWKFEKPRWINIDSGDYIYVSGYRYTGTSSEYTDTIIVLKYSPSGSLLWKKEIGHIWPGALNLRSELDAAGNLYLGTVGLNPGFELIKLDPAGNIIFHVTDASSLNQNFTSMRLKDNMIVLCSYAYNGTQASISVFDTSGSFLWSDLFPARGAMDVEMDDSLNIYILSQDYNQVGSSTQLDIQLFKFDSAGNLVSQSNYDFGGNYDAAVRMTLVNNRISVIGKSILAGQAYMDWITFQTDLSGNKLWDARYGFSLLNDEKPWWVTAAVNGDVYVSGQGGPDTVSATGSSYLRYVTVKYRNGNTLWTDAHPYQGYIGVANALDSQCGLYVLGETYMTAMHYSDSCFTVSLVESDIAGVKSFDLMPNPANDLVRLKFSIDNVGSVSSILYDLSGREHHRENYGNLDRGTHEISINLTNIADGIYLLKLIYDESVITKKFMVHSN